MRRCEGCGCDDNAQAAREDIVDLETLRATETAALVTLDAGVADVAERERALREEAAGSRAAIDAEHVRSCLSGQAARCRVQSTAVCAPVLPPNDAADGHVSRQPRW